MEKTPSQKIVPIQINQTDKILISKNYIETQDDFDKTLKRDNVTIVYNLNHLTIIKNYLSSLEFNKIILKYIKNFESLKSVNL